MNVTETVAKLCTPAIEKLGYDLFEVTYKKESSQQNLTLYIESKNGNPIALDDCEKVSSTVEAILDSEELDGQPYLLNISSIGLDRPIKTEKDFQRNKGKIIQVKLYSKQDGIKDFTGTLILWDSETVTVLVKDKKGEAEKTFKKKEIANIVPHIEF